MLEDVASVKDNAPVGEDYTTEEKSFDGYHFIGMDKTSDPATGLVAEGTKHVIYVYEKDVTPEVKKGNVDVTYVAEDGKVLEATSDVVKDGEIGSNYATEEKSFEGYHFVRMGEFSADTTGNVEEGTKHVVYVYAKDLEEKKGSVDVKYITTDGKVLEDVALVKDNAPVGEDYTTEEKSFDGYHFIGMDKTSDPATGVVAEGTKHVIYVYEKDVTPEVKKGNVDVTYLAEDGTVLEATSDVVKDGEIGSNYETTEKSFDGYHFVRMGEFSADKTGQVEEGTKHVVYVYAKNPETPVEKKGSVDVKYITKDGEVLEDVSSIKDNAPIGEDYTTEEKSFDGYHFVGMDKASDPATGVVAEGTKHVIYVYEKDVTPEVKKGNVDVTYLAEDGTVLEATSDVVKDGEVGSNYATEEKSFEGYHFVRMGEFSADATGNVEEGTKHVVYVYAKNPETPVEKKGSVDVITLQSVKIIQLKKRASMDITL
ncbi:MucBP domain-containing protein [Ligilactobacillus agilis]|uniref:MucBP domain-containing protein n=1 Tax=Ligilactobacillus agilis TaxID=1601 RepID=UPI00255CD1B0|nr:MucBP domain-containing protein [Ligilactobacillus agilis]